MSKYTLKVCIIIMNKKFNDHPHLRKKSKHKLDARFH